MQNRRTFIAFATVAAVATAAFTAPAFALGSLVEVELVDRGRSEPLQTWSYRGASWVVGRPSKRYAVRLTNRSGARLLVVLSIDGVNVVSGETAATGQAGYVLAPYQTTEITGWRKSLTESAAFYFTALPDSYAARTDRPDNVGVIGAAVFRERQREAYPPPARLPDWRGEIDRQSRPSRSMREPESSADASTAAAPDSKSAGMAAMIASTDLAPATASANTRRPLTPASSAPAIARTTWCASAMTATTSWSRSV